VGSAVVARVGKLQVTKNNNALKNPFKIRPKVNKV